ncbi:MAG TPA: 5-oxoprolinase subunit PxpB [Burkholderiaceae bacterium]
MPRPGKPGWRIEAAGDRCLIVEFGDRVDPAINRTVHALAERLLDEALEGVTDVVPAFTTVAVHYRPEAVALGASGKAEDPLPHARLSAALGSILEAGVQARDADQRTVEIPVCYGGEFGPDLDEVAAACGLSPAEVVALHGESPHVVYMLGFAPGFPYMGGLDPRLARPRRSTPRVRIAAGTVAIAREQSAVYTLETPGGWNLIGRTPIALFRPDADPPSLLRPGDRVRFVAISEADYRALRAAKT